MMKLLVLLALVAATFAKTRTVHADPARFKYIDMKTPFSGPCDVSEGPDGLVCVQEVLANKIVRYNQHTGELREFNIPFTLAPIVNKTLPLPGSAKAFLASCAIRNGYDGMMYFSNGLHNQLVQFDVHTNKVKVFTPTGLTQPLGNLQPLNDLTTAPEGVFFTSTSGNTITKFDYKTHKFTPYLIPTPASFTTGIYYASDGGIWFIEFAGQKAGRLDPKTGKFDIIPIPLDGDGPAVIRAETKAKNGDLLLWFPALIGGALCSINERTKKVTCYPDTAFDNPIEVAQDYHNNIWISHAAEDELSVFDPKHKNFTNFIFPKVVAPTPVSVPLYVGTGIYCKPVGNPFTKHGIGNAVWFTELTANRLVRFDLNGLKL